MRDKPHTLTMDDLLSCASLDNLRDVTFRLNNFLDLETPASPQRTHQSRTALQILKSSVNKLQQNIVLRLRGSLSILRSHGRINVSDTLTRYAIDKMFDEPFKDEQFLLEWATQCEDYYLKLSDCLAQTRDRVRKDIVFVDLPGSWLPKPMLDLAVSDRNLWWADLESCVLSASNSFSHRLDPPDHVRLKKKGVGSVVSKGYIAIAVVQKRFFLVHTRRGNVYVNEGTSDYISPTPKMDQLVAEAMDIKYPYVIQANSRKGLKVTSTVVVTITITPTWDSHHGFYSGRQEETDDIPDPEVDVAMHSLPQADSSTVERLYLPFIGRTKQAIEDANLLPDTISSQDIPRMAPYLFKGFPQLRSTSIEMLKGWKIA